MPHDAGVSKGALTRGIAIGRARGIEDVIANMSADASGQQPRLLVIAPHPDDEILGMGGQLWRWAGRADIVYVSDGAPDNPAFYEPLGFSRRSDYAEARWREANRALQIAGLGPESVHRLGFADQTVHRRLVPIARCLADLIADLAPRAVLVPPYEGGHPDHDGTALAAHAALRLLMQDAAPLPALVEYASYHSSNGGLVFGEFLPNPASNLHEVILDENARRLKRSMLACHATQAAFLRGVKVARESFRRAPAYDFRLPPGAPFHYDQVDWGTTGRQFLESAAVALSQLGLEEPC